MGENGKLALALNSPSCNGRGLAKLGHALSGPKPQKTRRQDQVAGGWGRRDPSPAHIDASTALYSQKGAQ